VAKCSAAASRPACNLVGERREEHQLGPLPAPALQHRRVGEEEAIVARDGDPRSERQQRGDRRSVGEGGRTGECDQPIDVETGCDRQRRARDDRFSRHPLARRNQAEMAFGQL
jgi:hypothetical protein